MIRDDLKAALVEAMKGGDKPKTATIRLIQAAIKNRDIEARTGKAPSDDDVLVTEVLQKMVKQRRESIDLYTKGGRPELADAEAAEVAIIEMFLPQQMSEAETTAAIEAIKKHKSAYLMAVGGAAYLVSKAIRGSRVVGFEDLGMEAIYEFDVQDMPVTVAVDANGTSVHETGPKEWKVKIEKMVA